MQNVLNNAQNNNLRILQQIDREQHFANHNNFTIVQSNKLEWQFPAFTKEWLNTTVHKTFETKFLNESLQRLRQKLVQGNKKRALIVVLPLKKWPNTNTKNFQLPKNDRIQIWILFSFSKVTKYEHHLAYQKWPNTNIIRLPKNDWIQTQIFCSPKRTKYELEQYSVSKKDRIHVLFGFPKLG